MPGWTPPWPASPVLRKSCAAYGPAHDRACLMPSFRHVAIGPGGVLVQGVTEAASEAALIEQLRRQGSLPMRVEPADRGFRANWLPTGLFSPRGLGRQDVADVTRELAIMLGAGQDLDRALRFLIETSTRPRMRTVLGALRDAVRDGSAFATALAQHPGSFSRLYVGLVRAGESGGALAPTLDRLATLLDRQRALSSTVTSALIYPGVLMLAAIGSVVLLLTDVLPQFVPLFSRKWCGAAALHRVDDRDRRRDRQLGAARAGRACGVVAGGHARAAATGTAPGVRPVPIAAAGHRVLAARGAGGPAHPHIGHIAGQWHAAGHGTGHRARRSWQRRWGAGGGDGHDRRTRRRRFGAPAGQSHACSPPAPSICCNWARRPRNSAPWRCGRPISTRRRPGWRCSGWYRC